MVKTSFVIISSILLFLILWFTPLGKIVCGVRQKEGYADQVIHGVVGGIAGPILPADWFEPPDKRVITSANVLFTLPDETLA